MTKEQFFASIDGEISKNKSKPFQVVQDYIKDEGDGHTITELFGKNWQVFYNECATKWPVDAADFKKAANEWFVGKYFVNDVSKFLDYIQKTDDAAAYYHCNVFQQLDEFTNKVMPIKFPMGTLSYIGARTARGKTTAMISMAVDAVNQGKTTYFYTNEEGTKQIIMRLVKAFLYTDYATGAWPSSFEFNESKRNYDFAPMAKQELGIFKDYSQFIRDTLRHPETETNGHELQRHVWASFRKVGNLLASKQITIIDGLAQRTFADLEKTLDNIKAGCVVFLDYIQHIRRPEAKGNAEYKAMQVASNVIADEAETTGFAFISGAQLNREGAGDDKFAPDELNEKYFRESGDLEQDAHIIIQIGMQKLPKGTTDAFGCNVSRFYEVIKQREHDQDTSQYRILDNAGFSLYGSSIDGTLEYFKPTEIKRDNAKAQNPRKQAAYNKPEAGGVLPNGDWLK